MNCAGTDGTESYEYAGHSKSNMAKMQQYLVGSLAGSFNPMALPISPNKDFPEENKHIRKATASLKKWKIPRLMKLAVATISSISLVVALSCQGRDNVLGYISSALNISQLRFKSISDQRTGYSFWTGIALTSSVSCMGFSYIYKLFLSTLDYENDIFSFPPTIPRKTKKTSR